jgi:hypothetical protein
VNIICIPTSLFNTKSPAFIFVADGSATNTNGCESAFIPNLNKTASNT